MRLRMYQLPVAGRHTRELGIAVAVQILRDRDVARQPELEGAHRGLVGAMNQVPLDGR